MCPVKLVFGKLAPPPGDLCQNQRVALQHVIQHVEAVTAVHIPQSTKNAEPARETKPVGRTFAIVAGSAFFVHYMHVQRGNWHLVYAREREVRLQKGLLSGAFVQPQLFFYSNCLLTSLL